MQYAKTVTVYLPRDLCENARNRRHNFIAQIETVLWQAGFDVVFQDERDAGGVFAADRGYSIFHMKEPYARRSLTIRRAYYYPFWQIEATNARWDWDLARAKFTPKECPGPEARRFFNNWRKRLFPNANWEAKGQGLIYVPLQGRLLEKRSFQYASPLEMVQNTLDLDPTRDVVATLHPKESYSDKERTALAEMASLNPRLRVETGGMERLLSACDYIVTQNSSVAFAGMFFQKPSVLFAKSDFHHICANVGRVGLERAFERVLERSPNYPRYLWWFLQHMSINAGRPDVQDQIRTRLARFGWPVVGE